MHHFGGLITIEEAAKYHTDPKPAGHGWPGIGYHVCIDLDGEKYMVNDLDRISYHCGGKNTESIGISLRGNWREKYPPEEMLESLDQVVEMCWFALGGPVPVEPHSKYRPTECPGELEKYLLFKYGHLLAEDYRIRKKRSFWNWWSSLGLFSNDDHLSNDDQLMNTTL